MKSVTELASLFNTTPETIRQWAMEFEQYLTPLANPGKNRARFFEDKDLKVMSLVAELTARRMRFDDIRVALENGELRDPPETALKLIDRGKVNQLQTEVVNLRTELTQAINDSHKKDGRIELLEQQLADAQREIRTLIGENAVLKSKVE